MADAFAARLQHAKPQLAHDAGLRDRRRRCAAIAILVEKVAIRYYFKSYEIFTAPYFESMKCHHTYNNPNWANGCRHNDNTGLCITAMARHTGRVHRWFVERPVSDDERIPQLRWRNVMQKSTINLQDLIILVAEQNPFERRIVQSMLRGFGANKLLEVDQSIEVLQALTNQKIDIMICDSQLPPHGALALTRAMRRKGDNQNRTTPVLVMTNDAREGTVKLTRDVGANMVIAKPMSPKSLYDRLAWIAFTPRQFIATATYFGPDRRFKIEGYPNGVGRRKSDKAVEVAAEAGPALGQDDIDSLFGAARSGQT